MWRGYGGNGKGVAIIFDTAKFKVAPPPTPLILSKVHYGTSDQRYNWLKAMAGRAAAVLTRHVIPDDKLALACFVIFDRIKLFALFTKHDGFKEEREWRAIYRRDLDAGRKFDPLFGYAMGKHGAEPKLKFTLGHIPEVTEEDITLERIVSGIMLGPTASSVLAQTSVRRMLSLLKKPQLAALVTASTIPLRES
jgi:hypothetical protein